MPVVFTALWAAVVVLELTYVMVLGPGPPPLEPLARALQLALAAYQLLNLLGNMGLFLRSDPSIRGVMLAGRGLGQGWAQSVSGSVRPSFCGGHVCGRCAAVRCWAAFPWDAAASGPDHVGVGSGSTLLRPGHEPQPAGSPGASLGPSLVLAFSSLSFAWRWDHFPDSN